MRIRTIKPEFWKHFQMSQLPAETRLLALGLLNFADDEGYFSAHPALIRGELMPFEEKTRHIPAMLAALEGIGYVTLTTGIDGQPLGKITNFIKHQRINRPTASKHSRTTHAQLTESSVSNHAQLTHDSALERNREQGREEEQGFLLAPDGAEPPATGSEASAAEPETGSDAKKEKGGDAEKLQWSEATGWQGFTADLWDELAKAYPACDIRRQFLAMEQWLKANPAKARKSNWRKFVTNWLAKEQDRGGDLKGRSPSQVFQEAFSAKKEAPPLTAEMPPPGYEAAMTALWGDDWQTALPGWPQMTASDKAQVRQWLRSHGKEAA